MSCVSAVSQILNQNIHFHGILHNRHDNEESQFYVTVSKSLSCQYKYNGSENTCSDDMVTNILLHNSKFLYNCTLLRIQKFLFKSFFHKQKLDMKQQ